MITETLRRAFGGGTFQAAEAAAVLGIRSPYSTLNRLKQAGILERLGRGTYRFAPLDSLLAVDMHLEREVVRGTRKGREATLAALARARWQAWLQEGYVKRLGPRRFKVRLATGSAQGLHVQRK